jgi:hypothetical protein
MAKPLATLIHELAIKAGIPKDHASLISLLSNADLSKITIPDDIVGEMEANLHTLDSAKPKLKATLFAEALNGVDSELARTMEELQLDDAIKTELLGEKSTPKRAAMLAKKIQELESKKAGTSKDVDKQKLVDEINALKNEKAKILNDFNAEKKSLLDGFDSRVVDMELKNLLSGYQYALPDDMDQRIKVETAMSTLRMAFANDGVTVKLIDGKPALVTAKDGSEYFDKSNNKKDLKSYTDGTLALNKLLKASGGAGGNAGNNGANGNGQQQQQQVAGAGGMGGSFFSAIETRISEEQNASK